MLSTFLLHIHAVTERMEHNSWENVAVLHDNIRSYFRLAAERFLDVYSSKIGFHSEIDSTNYPIEKIEAKFKVVVLLAWQKFAREVICLAYNHQPQLIYPIYQWIIVDQKDQLLKEVNFIYNGKLHSCSEDVMEQAIEGMIFTSYRLLNRENHHQSTDVDLTYEQYQDLYAEYLEKHLQDLDDFRTDYDEDAEVYAVSYYDATWALALALNASLGDNFSTPLEDYQHGQPELTGITRKHLSHLQFEGLMGKIAFRNSTHDSSTPLNIHQSIDGINTIIGIYNKTGLYFSQTKEVLF